LWAGVLSLGLVSVLLAFLGEEGPEGPPAAGPRVVYSGAGYDVSYPQCAGVDGQLPGARFSVVGVNAGRGFTSNPCLARQWQAARRPRSLYVNSGYNAGNLWRPGTACRREAAGSYPDPADAAHRDAYAIGCAEAEQSTAAAAGAGATRPQMWWIDVESANSWSDGDVTLNQAALRGELEALTRTGIPVGVYATFDDWNRITGGWSNSLIRANWVAGRPRERACAEPGFSGAPVWLVQDREPFPAPVLDVDRAC